MHQVHDGQVIFPPHFNTVAVTQRPHPGPDFYFREIVMADTGPNPRALAKEALARAYQTELGEAFAVLVDGLVTGDGAGANERFRAAVQMIGRAYRLAVQAVDEGES